MDCNIEPEVFYMSDMVAAKFAGESQEQVAFKLMLFVGQAEKKLSSSGQPVNGADRGWVLDTYTECLGAVLGKR